MCVCVCVFVCVICKILCGCYHKGMCKANNYTVQIIEKKQNERNRMDVKTSNKFPL